MKKFMYHTKCHNFLSKILLDVYKNVEIKATN